MPPVKGRWIVPELQQRGSNLLRFWHLFVRGVKAGFLVCTFGIFQVPQPPEISRSAVGIEEEPEMLRRLPIKLVLTSPPYPGVHVLYHRWQVQGRRETPAPFWIVTAASLDGDEIFSIVLSRNNWHELLIGTIRKHGECDITSSLVPSPAFPPHTPTV